MSEAVVDDIVAVLPPLLNALEALGFFARRLHPPAFVSVMNAIGAPDEALQTARAAIGEWPEQFTGLRERLDRACDETLAAFAGLREVERGNGDLVAVFWALMGDHADTPNLMRILETVRSRWTIDASRMLLTGMSDGGTFCYVTGLDGASPFTHLAPVSATFHPLMAEMVDAARLQGLPIFITHGKLDWMFSVQTARQTQAALAAAGANVTYREIDDLSHPYPTEVNAALVQ